MAEIHLRNSLAPALIDDADASLVAGWGWHVMSTGYVGAMTPNEDGRRTMILLHRLLMGFPSGEQVDHINGNKLDNRRSNLRVASATVNSLNQWKLRSTNTSGVLGVSPGRGKWAWRATIKVDKQWIDLGGFDDLWEAAEARWAAEIRYFGAMIPVSRQIQQDHYEYRRWAPNRHLR